MWSKHLKYNMLISYTAIVIFYVVVFGIINLVLMSNTVDSKTEEDTTRIADRIATRLDFSTLEDIVEKGEKSSSFLSTQYYLTEYRDISGAEYVYLMYKDGNEFKYLVDGSDPKSENYSQYGEVESEPDEALKKVYELKDIQTNETNVTDYGTLLSTYKPVLNWDGEVVAVIGVDFDVKSLQKTKTVAYKIILISMIVIILLSVLLNYVISTRLANDISKVSNRLIELKEGRVLHKPLECRRKDEVGMLYQSTNQLQIDLSNFSLTLRELSSKLESSRNEITNKATDSIVANQEFSIMTAHTKEKAREQMSFVEESSQLIQTTMSSTEETQNFLHLLKESVEENDLLSNEWISTLQNLLAEFELLNESLMKSNNELSELDNFVKGIDSILNLINSLSSKTDLLSLNAQIEAARAGDAGKGFAVVAQEVAKLSAETKKSVTDIEAHLKNISNSAFSAFEHTKRAVKVSNDSKTHTRKVMDSFNTIEENNTKIMNEVDTVIEVSKQVKGDCESSLTVINNIANISDEIVVEMKEIYEVSQHQIKENENMLEQTEKLTHVTGDLREIISKYEGGQ